MNRKAGYIREKGRRAAAGMGGLLLGIMLPFSALAAQTGAGPAGDAANIREEAQAMQPYSGDVNTLKTAKEASQIIIVIGNPEDPAKGNLSWYQKDASGVFKQVLSVEAVHGMNGISADKKEGDKKTPCGVYSFPMAFGMKENPGSILPYHQIQEGDHYVDDSESRYYNRLVNERDVQRDWNSSEVLITQAPQYNYGLVLNYNEDCAPGKGSAIFLHCPKASNNTGTSGCISVPEDYMKQIICSVDADTRIIVVPREADLAAY